MEKFYSNSQIGADIVKCSVCGKLFSVDEMVECSECGKGVCAFCSGLDIDGREVCKYCKQLEEEANFIEDLKASWNTIERDNDLSIIRNDDLECWDGKGYSDLDVIDFIFNEDY